MRRILDSLKGYIKADKEWGLEEYILSSGKKRMSHSAKFHSKEEELRALETEVLHCKKCDLYKTRTHPVFGAGDPEAELVFVGEAPGYEEDQQGLPFVGTAGQLLTKIIESIGLKRDEVYICNILKCRPPGNRNPRAEEVAACRPYLLKALDIISPRVILCLGRFAAWAVVGIDSGISKIRGTEYLYGNSKVMVTFHPGYLLRNPAAKRPVWEDMKKIKRILGN